MKVFSNRNNIANHIYGHVLHFRLFYNIVPNFQEVGEGWRYWLSGLIFLVEVSMKIVPQCSTTPIRWQKKNSKWPALIYIYIWSSGSYPLQKVWHRNSKIKFFETNFFFLVFLYVLWSYLKHYCRGWYFALPHSKWAFIRRKTKLMKS